MKAETSQPTNAGWASVSTPTFVIVSIVVAIGLGLLSFTIESLAILSVATTLFMWAALAQAWNILGGYGGYLNLGTAAFFGVGAYTAAILQHNLGWSPFQTAVLGGGAAVVLAVVIGVPSLRIRGVYFAILTLILTFLVQRLAFDIPITRGALGIFLDPVDMSPRGVEQLFYWVFLGIALVATLVVRTIERSRFGFALVAIKEDEDAAEILGVRTNRTKLYGLCAGAFIMGLVGAVFAYRVTFIDPDAAFSLGVSINPVIMAVYGGAGTWQGPIIGSAIVVVAGEFLRVTFGGIGLFGGTVPAEVSRLIFGAVLVVIALFARNGIMGLIRRRGGRKIGV